MFRKLTYTVIGTIACSLVNTVPGFSQNIDYTSDGFYDGVTSGVVGDWAAPGFEIFGTGYVQQGNRLVVGISSNLPFDGYRSRSAQDGKIRWGDLFLNVSDDDFETALANGNVYGVRFDPLNESGVSEQGVYQVQSVKSVARQNNGFKNINSYNRYVARAGETPYLGNMNMQDNFDYLPWIKSDNVINRGELLSTHVEYVSDLSVFGFDSDFGFEDNLAETGAYTYGFKFDISNLPGGQFMAHLFAECINDGTAFAGKIESVPEPGTIIGLVLVGSAAWAKRKKSA